MAISVSTNVSGVIEVGLQDYTGSTVRLASGAITHSTVTLTSTAATWRIGSGDVSVAPVELKIVPVHPVYRVGSGTATVDPVLSGSASTEVQSTGADLRQPVDLLGTAAKILGISGDDLQHSHTISGIGSITGEQGGGGNLQHSHELSGTGVYIVEGTGDLVLVHDLDGTGELVFSAFVGSGALTVNHTLDAAGFTQAPGTSGRRYRAHVIG